MTAKLTERLKNNFAQIKHLSIELSHNVYILSNWKILHAQMPKSPQLSLQPQTLPKKLPQHHIS